ncbi:uncharacterized protein LOC128244069 [Mya arenaria]|uniref:uncharacterized protein LOC128244069 n=1 Tax=Mya arenaria TaxID=6604 RepID=UPI0022E280EB|nr:uncharacterized protein LOC128244069 [Mya arenaria]
MDSTGLLSLCINNDFLRRHIDDISNFEKVRNWRNILFHSPSLEFQESDMKRAIQDMINVLEDKKLLVNEGSAQSAVVKLSEITTEDFVLTLEESRSLLSEMINAIEIQKYAAIREINAYTDTKLDAIRAEFVKYRDQVTDMEAFRTYLVETYKNHCLTSDVSPLFPEEDDNIDDLYVSLQMERRTQTLGKKEISASRGADIYRSRTSEVAEQLNTFEELFKKNGEGVENIFIVADAGMGKTTLCRKITSTWCTANDEQEYVDSEVHLKGVTFANASVLAGIALDKLNKRRGKRLKVEDFIAEIENKHLKAIRHMRENKI